MHDQDIALIAGEDPEAMAKEHALTLMQAHLGIRVADRRFLVGLLDAHIEALLQGPQFRDQFQEVQFGASLLLVTERQIMGLLDGRVGDEQGALHRVEP